MSKKASFKLNDRVVVKHGSPNHYKELWGKSGKIIKDYGFYNNFDCLYRVQFDIPIAVSGGLINEREIYEADLELELSKLEEQDRTPESYFFGKDDIEEATDQNNPVRVILNIGELDTKSFVKV